MEIRQIQYFVAAMRRALLRHRSRIASLDFGPIHVPGLAIISPDTKTGKLVGWDILWEESVVC